MPINKTHFQQLTTDRLDSLRLLNKASMRGIRDSVVEKYSETAHFVYELLQNADDVKATKVVFKLRKEGLYFIHNGTVPFTVSPPNQQPVGHINAITSIGQSSKKDENYQIGKFGIGFKSVFQYTLQPEVYDPQVAFRIRDLIVPELLDEVQHPLQNRGETLFYFPFNHPNKPAKEAVAEIEERLQELQQPLLFLRHLTLIEWETPNLSGFFKKEKTDTQQDKDLNIALSRLRMTQRKGKKQTEQELLALAREEAQTGLSYQLVFHIQDQQKVLPLSDQAAYCYFPTRVKTGFNFLLHAPFLLTDSREGIKLGAAWNQKLVTLLAHLLTDSFSLLAKEGLLTTAFYQILPIKNYKKNSLEARFFQPITQHLHQFLRTTKAAFFPSQNGKLISCLSAYLADSQSLMTMLPQTALADWSQDAEARWVFPEVPVQSDLGGFIKQLLSEAAQLQQRRMAIVDWELFIKKLRADFLQKQTDEWLIKLYEELWQHHRSLWNLARKSPIIRLENGEMVTPFSAETGLPHAWLPTDLGTNYPTVKKSLADVPLVWTFLENIGLSTPDLREELEKHILPKYAQATSPPTIADIEKIIARYFQSTTEEAEQLVERLQDLPILEAISSFDGSVVTAKARETYLAEADLFSYFADNPQVKWLTIDGVYEDLLSKFSAEQLRRFFIKIGVRTLPAVQRAIDSLDDEEREELMRQETPEASYPMWEEVEDYEIEGLDYFLNQNLNQEKSILLWNILTRLYEQETLPTKGVYRYQYQATHEVYFSPYWLKLLQDKPWFLNADNVLVAPNDTYKGDWSSLYEMDGTHPLLDLLFVKNQDSRLAGLTTEERQAMELGQRLLKDGLSVNDLQHFQQWQQRKERKEEQKKKPKRRIKKAQEIDTDEFNPAFLNSEELLEKQEELRQRLQAELQDELDALMKIEQLKAIIQEAVPYTFRWYQALLELEYILAFDQTDKDKSLSIFFSKVELEAGTSKTILLKKPARYIPQRIEDMGDIQLKIQLEDERRTLAVEVVSIKDFSLRAKLKSPEEIDGLDFTKIRGGVLDIQNTIFTLEELIKSFHELPFEAEENLRDLLPEHIRFVFGPPGTGKTTHLSRNEIMPAMMGEKPLKMLVLTPTNKSADVLARKVLELLPEPPEWLLRFGTSGDSMVENAGLLRDSSFDIYSLDNYCVITTATRFPYDGFNYGHAEAKLKNLDWDVILVDEASMISLAMMTFILHQKPTTEFIIAGDPFQIEPIVYAEEWKGQNIYTLVNLQSFKPEEQAEQLVPRVYPVKNLTTQYRALRTLGYVFSHYAYDSQLDHFRKKEQQRPLTIEKLPLKDINIIRFPVHKLETLYRPQRLNGSHYHIYAALLTAELVKYLTQQIYQNHIQNQADAKPWKIGIICPYKAEAMLVDKIIASQAIFKPKVSISCGTIHSFQGDECDIIINLYNPPLRISKSPQMFLNRKNILNVALSRAKDYLILILPDEQTENIENLHQINRVLGIIRYYLAGVTQTLHSYEVEERLFGQVDYIEKNTFATTHQQINVYTEPEKQFEIRAEEQAVDVQIRKED